MLYRRERKQKKNILVNFIELIYYVLTYLGQIQIIIK